MYDFSDDIGLRNLPCTCDLFLDKDLRIYRPWTWNNQGRRSFKSQMNDVRGQLIRYRLWWSIAWSTMVLFHLDRMVTVTDWWHQRITALLHDTVCISNCLLLTHEHVNNTSRLLWSCSSTSYGLCLSGSYSNYAHSLSADRVVKPWSAATGKSSLLPFQSITFAEVCHDIM